ncbi:MAG: hypothetical protein HY318_20725 [Armatimonadetes bacterium]|nr:hypothetical protein [Armatimonadota bacterium]
MAKQKTSQSKDKGKEVSIEEKPDVDFLRAVPTIAKLLMKDYVKLVEAGTVTLDDVKAIQKAFKTITVDVKRATDGNEGTIGPRATCCGRCYPDWKACKATGGTDCDAKYATCVRTCKPC